MPSLLNVAIPVCNLTKSEFCFQEAKIDRNMFASQSEEVWKSMDEADCCDVLCMPLQARKYKK